MIDLNNVFNDPEVIERIEEAEMQIDEQQVTINLLRKEREILEGALNDAYSVFEYLEINDEIVSDDLTVTLAMQRIEKALQDVLEIGETSD